MNLLQRKDRTDASVAFDKRDPLIYVLHSSQMYGTERMALATAQGLQDSFQTIIVAPNGPAIWEAKRLGFDTRCFQSMRDLAAVLKPFLQAHPALTCVATSPRFSMVCMALNLIYRRRINQIQMIHGGGDELSDFGRLKLFNFLDVTFVTVSDYVRQRLIDFGVRPDRIEVIVNFLSADRISAITQRAPLTCGVRRAVVVSRMDAVKQVDLLLDALDARRDLADFPIDVFGDGEGLEKFRARAANAYPNVRFLGYERNVLAKYADGDLLIHTCSTEPFGLVILEAMAARIPVLVPDQGGAATLVENGVSGFTFRARCASHLGECLATLRCASPESLNKVIANAADRLETRFSAGSSIRRYREIFSARFRYL